MRAKFIYILLTLLGFLPLLSSCTSNDDDIDGSNNVEIKLIENTATTGSWVITSLIDSGVDETSHFIGYSFTFNSNGTVVAMKNSEVINGTWSVTDGSNSDDDNDSMDDIDFNINFESPVNFNDDLSEDWEIVMYNTSKIELIHISGGNGGTDHVIFERTS